MTVTVSPDPDVVVSITPPGRVDLGVPFPLPIYVLNRSAVVAHDVEVTVDFGADIGVRPVPAGCSNPAAGRLVCRAGSVNRSAAVDTPTFVATLIAPPAFSSGGMTFTASAVEREHDFDASTNTAKSMSSLYPTIYVTTTADSGAGSLRQAILDANAAATTTTPTTIGFRIAAPSPTPWKTIRVDSPLPAVTAYGVRIQGSTQTGLLGDTNVDGPEIEISGGGTIDGDGLVIATCFAEVANLAIGGFRGNGVSVTDSLNPTCGSFYSTELHHLFAGTDPTGSTAQPNGRGLGISVPGNIDFNSQPFHGPTNIHDCVISGNVRSGIFGLSGRLNITNNRIGVKAHADEPLPNGASGVFIGPGCYGSDVGADVFNAFRTPVIGGNVIAFNGETGVAIATGLKDVAIRNNRIWGNNLLGIDIGLDGPTESAPSDYGDPVAMPVLTIAHFDPVSKKTVIEGDLPPIVVGGVFSFTINVFANDGPDPSRHGEGQRPLGPATMDTGRQHFHFEADGDLTGQWITATNTRNHYVGFAKPEGIDQGFLTQTSEFSRALEVR